ncbi:MAG TPA: thiamine-phosphate kinase, partial [Polyangiaceae bacterium]|nr:thiamine-phosphate kinase [Polyangiaceae bacterium]
MDEQQLVERFRRSMARADPRVRLGIGDDAAVLSDGTVLSVDAVVEGVHFERSWLGLPELGFRGTVAALSDLAAMGASPVAILSSLTASEASDGQALMIGVEQAAKQYGAVVVGGNVARGDTLSLHTTVVGRCEAAFTRSGARPGDAIFVTGTLGSAALGWRRLRAEEPEQPFVSRWRRPSARFDIASQIQPTACIDISDGLVRELGLICSASDVAAHLDVSAVPVHPQLAASARALAEWSDVDADLHADHLALYGGEDYELLFTAPISLSPEVATRIGEIRPGEGVMITT